MKMSGINLYLKAKSKNKDKNNEYRILQKFQWQRTRKRFYR